ncbi:LysE family translocator [Candidatus Protochlamydia phocaeensis]|uniref:LysE family translocator n=1 Tax=Candidatus Protochlamydia phocaeensis TaxID=1414722 RepID=UPI000838CEC9|nr:LysE family transporter [Candidatus Protochlamydia phocaeensis]
MLFNLLAEGTLIGFLIAMPVGPIGMLCIRNSLSWGMRYGFATGMGAALADALYGALAGFGIATLTPLIMDYQFWFQLSGGVFLCYLGWNTLRINRIKEQHGFKKSSLRRVFLTTFFLTLTNPLTILCFAGVYAGLGVGLNESGLDTAFTLTIGVFIGSAIWWLLLSSTTALLRKKLNSSVSKWINRVSGTILIGFGLAAFLI